MAYRIRYYQENAVLAFYDFFQKSAATPEIPANPILAMPTGSGKSIVIAEILRSVFHYFPGQRAMMLTHVHELISQNYEELVDLWPLAPAGIYSAGLKRKEVRPITFAGIASVVGKAELFGHQDLLFIDECHLVSPKEETSYQNFIADLRLVNPALKVIGLTATPYRLGQGLLTMPVQTSKGPRPSLFTDIAYDITGLAAFNRLIEEGFLCRLVPKRTREVLDVSQVGTAMGEFKLDELQIVVDREEISRRAIDEMQSTAEAMVHSSGRPRCRWLIFATGVEHTEHVAAEFAERGYAVRSVHSGTKGVPKTADQERKKIVAWFKEETDDVRVVVNNGVFTTGFNCKQLDLIGVLRPTNSPGLWVQILGRGTRPYEGKDDCLVLDFAGNTKRLGPINDPVLPRGKGQGKGDAPVKVCEPCGTYNHASVRFCTCCGAEFPRHVKIVAEAANKELIKGSAPETEIFPVSMVTYDVYVPASRDKPPSLRVVYHCGKVQKFSEWICFEHGGFVGEKARKWWRRATHMEAPAPLSTEEAHQRVGELDKPSHIRVLVNLRHPRVMDQDYSGTAFKTASISGLPQEKAIA